MPNTRLVCRLAIVTATLLLASGCGVDEAVAPTGDAITSAKADQSWERASFFQDAIVHVECLGEDLRFLGEVPYTYHEVTSGSGNFQFRWFAPPTTPNSPDFRAYGMTSGKVFDVKGAPFNQMFHLSAGETQSIVQNERWIAEDGSGFLATATLQVAIDANGVLRVNNYAPFTIECFDR